MDRSFESYRIIERITEDNCRPNSIDFHARYCDAEKEPFFVSAYFNQSYFNWFWSSGWVFFLRVLSLSTTRTVWLIPGTVTEPFKEQPIKQDSWYLNCVSEPYEPKVRRDLSLLLNPGGKFRIEPEYTSRNLICDNFLQTKQSECKKPPRCKERYTVCQSG